MLARNLLTLSALVMLLAGCSSSASRAPQTVSPPVGSKVALMVDFDQHSHTVWIGNAFMHENIKTAKQPGWNLVDKLGKPLLSSLASDAGRYQVRPIAGLGLAMKRQLQGGTVEGYITLPRAMTNPTMLAFASPSLEDNLRQAFGLEYDALKAAGYQYLVLLRQLPMVADEDSKEGSDRRILNTYGYYLKCDRTYQECEVPRALLRGQVELVDLSRMQYVGAYGFSMNVPVPLDAGEDGASSPEAMRLIDAHLQTLSLEIQMFLKEKGLLSEGDKQGAALSI